MAKKYICKVCGYVHTGDKAPAVCPQCQQHRYDDHYHRHIDECVDITIRIQFHSFASLCKFIAGAV